MESIVGLLREEEHQCGHGFQRRCPKRATLDTSDTCRASALSATELGRGNASGTRGVEFAGEAVLPQRYACH